MVPRRPRSFSRIRPVATGGMTKGSEISVSTIDLPRQSARASSQAAANPGNKIATVLRAETQAVNQIICHSSALTGRAYLSLQDDESVFFEYSRGFRRV